METVKLTIKTTVYMIRILSPYLVVSVPAAVYITNKIANKFEEE